MKRGWERRRAGTVARKAKGKGKNDADTGVPDMRMILLGEAEVFACGYFLTHLPNQFLLNRPRLRRASPLPSSAAA